MCVCSGKLPTFCLLEGPRDAVYPIDEDYKDAFADLTCAARNAKQKRAGGRCDSVNLATPEVCEKWFRLLLTFHRRLKPLVLCYFRKALALFSRRAKFASAQVWSKASEAPESRACPCVGVAICSLRCWRMGRALRCTWLQARALLLLPTLLGEALHRTCRH